MFDMFDITGPSTPQPGTTAFVIRVVDAPALRSAIARELIVGGCTMCRISDTIAFKGARLC